MKKHQLLDSLSRIRLCPSVCLLAKRFSSLIQSPFLTWSVGRQHGDPRSAKKVTGWWRRSCCSPYLPMFWFTVIALICWDTEHRRHKMKSSVSVCTKMQRWCKIWVLILTGVKKVRSQLFLPQLSCFQNIKVFVCVKIFWAASQTSSKNDAS